MPRPRKTKRDHQHDQLVGERLAALRRARGFTQTELAEALGVGQAVVSQYERGRTGLDGRIVLQVCRVLGVGSDELLGLKAAKGTADQVRRPFLRRLRQIERLSKRDQQALLRTIDAFLGNADLRKSA
jgi:transcriptional regulator with XRE-family HTH domain